MDETESPSDKKPPAWQALFDEILRQQDERPDEIGSALLEGRASRHADVRACVLRHLPLDALMEKPWRDFLLACLQDRDRFVRMEAAEAAHEMQFAPAVPLLVQLLEDRDALVRVEAVEGLAALKATTSAPRLEDLLQHDAHYLVRGYAAKSLAALLGCNALPILERRLREERSSWAKAQLLMHTCTLGRTELFPQILKRLKSRRRGVRAYIANNIDLIVNDENRPSVIVALSEALSRETNPGVLEYLEDALERLQEEEEDE